MQIQIQVVVISILTQSAESKRDAVRSGMQCEGNIEARETI
jgi:hypothetical protein